MSSKPTKSTLIKEIIGFGFMTLLFLSFTFHHYIGELSQNFDKEQYYQGTALILDSRVDFVTKKTSPPVKGSRTTDYYYVYAHFQYESMGKTYQSHRISNLGNHLSSDRKSAYKAINTYLKADKYIEININKTAPEYSYLFRGKLPQSSNRKEIVTFFLAMLGFFALVKSIRQLRGASHKSTLLSKTPSL